MKDTDWYSEKIIHLEDRISILERDVAFLRGFVPISCYEHERPWNKTHLLTKEKIDEIFKEVFEEIWEEQKQNTPPPEKTPPT